MHPFDEDISHLLHQLMERIAKEQEPEKLHGLVVGINRPLDAVEAQLARIEGQSWVT